MADVLCPSANFSLRDHDPGPPGPQEVRIAVRAAGVSFVDVLTAEGKHHVQPAVPFIPGSEFSGIIEQLGAAVTGLAVGDAVIGTRFGGIFADVLNLRASNVWPSPAGMSFEEAAVFPVSYTTSWHALIDRGRLRAGETLLILGAAGATGFAAVQFGKDLGARVIASASGAAKRQAALAGGADAVVDSHAAHWREDVAAANNGKPIDVVYDPVGGSATDTAFRTLGYDGRHLIVGFPAGIASVRTNLPLLKASSLTGVNLRQFGERFPEHAEANRRQVYALAGAGHFRPVVAARFPLEAFAAAMEAAYSGRSAGRIVLLMSGGPHTTVGDAAAP
jgi:NADPH:quinone reductase